MLGPRSAKLYPNSKISLWNPPAHQLPDSSCILQVHLKRNLTRDYPIKAQDVALNGACSI